MPQSNSVESNGVGEEQPAKFIPMLFVPSTRDILQSFNTQIVELESGGSRMESNRVEGTSIPEVGLTVDEKRQESVVIDYTKDRSSSGEPRNEITEEIAERISESIHSSLSIIGNRNNSPEYKYDIPCTRFVIEIDDVALRQEYGLEKDTFFLEFELHESFQESMIDEMAKPLLEERGLLEQGFKKRYPVLKRIIPKMGWNYGRGEHEAVFEWDVEDPNTQPLMATSSTYICSHLPEEISHNANVSLLNKERWYLG